MYKIITENNIDITIINRVYFPLIHLLNHSKRFMITNIPSKFLRARPDDIGSPVPDHDVLDTSRHTFSKEAESSSLQRPVVPSRHASEAPIRIQNAPCRRHINLSEFEIVPRVDRWRQVQIIVQESKATQLQHFQILFGKYSRYGGEG